MNPEEVGTTLLSVVSEMVFCTGFVHLDPHPGNVLVRPRPYLDVTHAFWRRLGDCLFRRNGKEPQLVLLDCGLCCELPRPIRTAYAKLWCSLAMGDHKGLRAAAAELGVAGPHAEAFPLMLRRSELSREQRQAYRQASGIHSAEDASNALAQLPGVLLKTIRTTTLVRGMARDLGVSSSRRWQMLTQYAAICPTRELWEGKMCASWWTWVSAYARAFSVIVWLATISNLC
mmetsp:Transcript_7028/g.13352  ORF Transcript_7028/g.13352 Transcript_7028/m.13352 type:complete len:230 (+) Transcript_7028:1-690(+)